MKSYTTLRALYGSLTEDNSTANLTLGDQLVNDEYRHLVGLKDFNFVHRLRTMTTTASTQFKALPYDVDQVESLYVTVSSTRYTPKLITSREQWDILNRSVYTSDIPVYAFVFEGQLGLWPTPATSSNVITINAKIRVIDLSAADYTAGSILTATNGATAVTGNGTTWTERMGGRWIRISYSDTNNTGDGEWYEIASVASATSLTLVRPYGGTSIAIGTAPYTIGQMPILPEEYHDTPVFRAAATYWLRKKDSNTAQNYMAKYEADKAALITQRTAPITDLVVDAGWDDADLLLNTNPNLYVNL